MMKKKKETSIFRQELRRDWNTFKRLGMKDKIQFLFDYYKWYILAFIAAILILVTLGNILWQGQKPYRLRVCAVLNNDETDCSVWFKNFEKELKKDGKSGDLDLNQDQPFDYDNSYYYVQEMEVMSTVSSQRMDVAICGPDLYNYLLALNACLSLDQAFDSATFEQLKDSGILLEDTANLQMQKDGTVDESKGIKGYFAIDITDTEFGKFHNRDAEADKDGNIPHLYAIIIRNTEHLDDSLKLINAIKNE